jgi:protein-disulfide isomerase
MFHDLLNIVSPIETIGLRRNSHELENMAKKKIAKSNPWIVVCIVLGVVLFVSLLANAILTTLLVIGGTTTIDQAAPSVAAPSAPSAAPSGAPVEVSADDDPVLGDPDAPVTLIEFSDYECPFCGRFYSDALGQIKENYIDTGKAKLIIRDFPLSFHPRAVPSAIAAECIQELAGDEAYFEYHDLLFENQGDLSDSALRRHAETVGVDTGDWDSCYADEDGAVRAEVNADFKAGQAAGVSGTPTVFVNGQKIVGAQPYSVFEAAIEAALN